MDLCGVRDDGIEHPKLLGNNYDETNSVELADSCDWRDKMGSWGQTSCASQRKFIEIKTAAGWLGSRICVNISVCVKSGLEIRPLIFG